jgi:hypothetical protein
MRKMDGNLITILTSSMPAPILKFPLLKSRSTNKMSMPSKQEAGEQLTKSIVSLPAAFEEPSATDT